MNVPKAIEFLEDEVIYRHYKRQDITQAIFDKFEENKQNVINLLKCGEEYKHKIKKLENYIEEEIQKYKKLFTEDLKSNGEIDMAMDREATRVLTKIKTFLREK